MVLPWFFFIFAFIFGALIGSFLNVCIVRIPAGESIVRPRSKCPQCGCLVRAYDNIPILSFILLRGQCRDCRIPISFQYPLVEILSGMLAMASLWKFYQPGLAALWFLGFICPLLVVSVIDLKILMIPDVISLPFILVGFLVRLIAAKFHQPQVLLLDSFLGVLLGAGALFLVAKTYEWIKRGEVGMGLGDVKLAGMIGAFLGWKAVLVVFVLSSFLGSVVGILIMIFSKKGLKTQIPFGPFLSLGALMNLFWGNQILISYFHWVHTHLSK